MDQTALSIALYIGISVFIGIVLLAFLARFVWRSVGEQLAPKGIAGVAVPASRKLGFLTGAALIGLGLSGVALGFGQFVAPSSVSPFGPSRCVICGDPSAVKVVTAYQRAPNVRTPLSDAGAFCSNHHGSLIGTIYPVLTGGVGLAMLLGGFRLRQAARGTPA